MKELLDKLEKLDYDTWRRIMMGIPHDDFCQIPLSGLSKDVALDHIQGEIQRAIKSKIDPSEKKARHILGYSISEDIDGIVAWIGATDRRYRGTGNSPAEALLEAYIAVIEEEV